MGSWQDRAQGRGRNDIGYYDWQPNRNGISDNGFLNRPLVLVLCGDEMSMSDIMRAYSEMRHAEDRYENLIKNLEQWQIDDFLNEISSDCPKARAYLNYEDVKNQAIRKVLKKKNPTGRIHSLLIEMQFRGLVP